MLRASLKEAGCPWQLAWFSSRTRGDLSWTNCTHPLVPAIRDSDHQASPGYPREFAWLWWLASTLLPRLGSIGRRYRKGRHSDEIVAGWICLFRSFAYDTWAYQCRSSPALDSHILDCGVNVHFGGFVGYSGMKTTSVNGAYKGRRHGQAPTQSNSLTIGEDHVYLKQTALPNRIILTRNATLPLLHIQRSLRRAMRFRVKAVWMVPAPLPSIESHLCQSCDTFERRCTDRLVCLTAPRWGDLDKAMTFRRVRKGKMTGEKIEKEKEKKEKRIALSFSSILLLLWQRSCLYDACAADLCIGTKQSWTIENAERAIHQRFLPEEKEEEEGEKKREGREDPLKRKNGWRPLYSCRRRNDEWRRRLPRKATEPISSKHVTIMWYRSGLLGLVVEKRRAWGDKKNKGPFTLVQKTIKQVVKGMKRNNWRNRWMSS